MTTTMFDFSNLIKEKSLAAIMFIFIFMMYKNLQQQPTCKKIKLKSNTIKEKKANYKTMRTRSQTIKEKEQELQKKEAIPAKTESEKKENQPLYEVDIDFDEAKKAWRANKIALKNGCFRYKKINIRNKTI